MVLHRGVGIDVDAQITHGTNWQHRGVAYMDSSSQDEILAPKRQAPEPFGLRGVEQQPVSPYPR